MIKCSIKDTKPVNTFQFERNQIFFFFFLNFLWWGKEKRKNKNNIRTFPPVLDRSLTVVIHNVDGVLIFGEAESLAAGQAQQRHQGTEHRERHGWGQVTALLNYLQTGTQP